MSVSIYTDGSCLGNPGIGGWAFYWLMILNFLIVATL